MIANETGNKEVAIVEKKASKALESVNAISITTDAELASATDQLSQIKTIAKEVKERKEAITKPLNEALTSARDLFKPTESNLSDAERIIKGKMLAYQEEQDKARIEATAKLADRVERGTMKAGTALKKMEDLPSATTSMQGAKGGSIMTRTVKKYRVTDETKLAREFLTPDMGKIIEALKAGRQVEGAEVYEEKVISAR